MSQRTRLQRNHRRYVVLLGLVVATLILCISFSRVAGHFVRPPFFLAFRILNYVQQGLMCGALLAILGAFWPRRLVVLAPVVYGGVFLWFAWFCVWGLIRALVGFDLMPSQVYSLLLNPGAFQPSGLGSGEMTLILAVAFSLIALLSVAWLYLTLHTEIRFRRKVALTMMVFFLCVNLPTRAYLTYHINRERFAALALDDHMPFTLRTEALIPGLRNPRPVLENPQQPARTEAYLDWLRNQKFPAIPKIWNILWFSVESLRFDVLSPELTPNIWKHRERFQLRLDQQHWSGGNTTQYGTFSMLSGLSGTHLIPFRDAKAHYPLFEMLAQNGYRLRMGKTDHNYLTKEDPFLPPGTLVPEIDSEPMYRNDAEVVDRYLADRASRDPQQPFLDFVDLDSTHWYYSFPPEFLIFRPASELSGGIHFARTPDEVQHLYNRYKNACLYLDSQIGRILDDVDARGDWERTVVLLTGDHGEEFQEMGQLGHSSVLNDYQGRTALWMHFPGRSSDGIALDRMTVHMDIVPTILDAMGFEEDVLRSQGCSLLRDCPPRSMLILAEAGYHFPFYLAFVTSRSITRWWNTPDSFTFSGVQRRDGKPAEGLEWWDEVQKQFPQAAAENLLLPDVQAPLHRF